MAAATLPLSRSLAAPARARVARPRSASLQHAASPPPPPTARISCLALRTAARRRGVRASAAAEPPPPPPRPPELRQYQAASVADLYSRITEAGRCGVARFSSPPVGRSSFSEPCRCVYVLPTGGGKTVVLAALMEQLAAASRRTLFLVHRKELVSQTVEHLRRVGIDAGVILSSVKPRPQQPVQVASVQTLNRRLARLQDYGAFGQVIVDECHHATADSYQRVLDLLPRAAVLGTTATPYRLDGKGLWPTFTSMLEGPSVRELMAGGFLVAARVFQGRQLTQVDTRGVKQEMGDFAVRALASKARVITGNVVREFAKHAPAGARALVYAVSVEHSKQLVAEFRDAGCAAEHIDGGTAQRERDAIIARVRGGETRILCNCEIVTEGFDVPEVEVIVLVRPTLSRALHRQMLGRGLRPAEGKSECLVLDHAGNVARHGLPEAKERYSLFGEERLRADAEARAATRDGGRGGPVFEDGELTEVRRAREPVDVVSADNPNHVLKHCTFEHEHGASWDVVLVTDKGQRATLGDRSLFPRDAELHWRSAQWRGDVYKLFVEPKWSDVKGHVENVSRMARDKGKSVEWTAERLLEKWGRRVAQQLVMPAEESGSAVQLGGPRLREDVAAQLKSTLAATEHGPSLAEKYRALPGATVMRFLAIAVSTSAADRARIVAESRNIAESAFTLVGTVSSADAAAEWMARRILEQWGRRVAEQLVLPPEAGAAAQLAALPGGGPNASAVVKEKLKSILASAETAPS